VADEGCVSFARLVYVQGIEVSRALTSVMRRHGAEEVQDAPALLERRRSRLARRRRLCVGAYWRVSAPAPCRRVGVKNGGRDEPCDEDADDYAEEDGKRRRHPTGFPRWLHGAGWLSRLEGAEQRVYQLSPIAVARWRCWCWSRAAGKRRSGGSNDFGLLRRGQGRSTVGCCPNMSASSTSSSPSMPPVLLCPPQKSDPSPLLQRRAAKSSAFITPPTPGIPPSAILSSADKHPSRLNQRTLGLPNRIWLILALFLSVLLFTRLVLPSHHNSSPYYLHHRPSSYSAGLHPINYLNLSDADTEAAQNPFPFCPTFGRGDFLSEKYGPLAISKSWSHLGSGARVQQVIHRALLGQPVTISIIGGSSEHLC
jgi:hypothetical protein